MHHLTDYLKATGCKMHSPENLFILRRHLDSEILCEVTQLVESLLDSPEACCELDVDHQALQCARFRYHYESPAQQGGYELIVEQDGFCWRKANPAFWDDGQDLPSDAPPEPQWIKGSRFPTALEAWKAACQDGDLEACEDMVLSHLLVRASFADKLSARGEAILPSLCGIGPVWCCTTYRHLVVKDYLIADIGAEMGILIGQSGHP